jgi:hypothetical protein
LPRSPRSGPTVGELAPTTHSAADWGALRTKQPEKFAKAVSEDAVDDSAILLRAMDKYGVTHAVLQTGTERGRVLIINYWRKEKPAMNRSKE